MSNLRYHGYLLKAFPPGKKRGGPPAPVKFLEVDINNPNEFAGLSLQDFKKICLSQQHSPATLSLFVLKLIRDDRDDVLAEVWENFVFIHPHEKMHETIVRIGQAIDFESSKCAKYFFDFALRWSADLFIEILPEFFYNQNLALIEYIHAQGVRAPQAFAKAVVRNQLDVVRASLPLYLDTFEPKDIYSMAKHCVACNATDMVNLLIRTREDLNGLATSYTKYQKFHQYALTRTDLA